MEIMNQKIADGLTESRKIITEETIEDFILANEHSKNKGENKKSTLTNTFKYKCHI